MPSALAVAVSLSHSRGAAWRHSVAQRREELSEPAGSAGCTLLGECVRGCSGAAVQRPICRLPLMCRTSPAAHIQITFTHTFTLGFARACVTRRRGRQPAGSQRVAVQYHYSALPPRSTVSKSRRKGENPFRKISLSSLDMTMTTYFIWKIHCLVMSYDHRHVSATRACMACEGCAQWARNR